MISLKCVVKHYDWGEIGRKSFVAKLLMTQNEPINEKLPYAELWMGTHKSGPSTVCDLSPEFNNQSLAKLLELWPEFLGTINLYKKYGKKLPFLFKVLSVGKPLSIQVHPDKPLAAELNATKPNLYPDSNHKPEMAIAMTKFYALAYFRPHNEIIKYLEEFSDLRDVVGEEACAEYFQSDEANKREALKKCFSMLMKASPEKVKEKLQSLVSIAETRQSPDLSMFLWIVRFYPDDVGCLAFFFLNVVELNPNEALYIDVREPHCYINGNCLEIMAESDNVIRAGLTPKFKDVELLCECLTYEPRRPEEFVIKPRTVDRYTSEYIPPAEEFAIEKIHVPEASSLGGYASHTAESKSSGSIILVLKCLEAKCSDDIHLKSGKIYFYPAGLKLDISQIKGELTLYRAFVRE
ncbi:mannose phosphate isomerase [Brevipalpus obovatus]|uniref:mannose phosphate isomerase n=1 Tax=Brevipalpus obovatus TaxID=246614 RepID=UPI003D9E00A0